MDIFVLLATMLVCFVIGMPIAYSLAMAAIVGALSIGVPLEAVMLKISDGVSKVAMLTIPFFVLAGAIMAEGGMARRMVAFADVLVGFTRVRGGLSVGITYLPIPVGGVCLLLFIVERIFLGAPPDPLRLHREDVSFD